MTVITNASPSALPPPAATVPPSCVHDVFRAVQAWEHDNGARALRLHVGEPGFRPADAVVEEIAATVRDGRAGYSDAAGLPELRETLAAKLTTANGHDTHPDLIFATPGSTQGLLAVLTSLAEPGGELLLPALHWPVHLQQALVAGLRPRFYRLDEHDRPDLGSLHDVPPGPGKVLLVNTPANPTGAVCDEALLHGLLALARARGWSVVSDEAYEDYVFAGTHLSTAALERDLPPDERRVFSAFSFSKSHAMTGYRLGYVVAPNARRAAALRVVQEASIVCPATPVQWAGVAALQDRDPVRRNVEAVASTRDRALRPLRDRGLLRRLPDGGWYALLDVRRLGVDAEEFAGRLLRQQGVALAPARGFALRPEIDGAGRVRSTAVGENAATLLRIALCGDGDVVAEGARRIETFASSETFGSGL